MLKRFLKGLGVAFACSYALASPQNTIFLNENIKKENRRTQYNSYINDLTLNDLENNKQFIYKIDIIFSENNHCYSNFADDYNDFDIDFTNNDASSDNTNFLTLYIASYKDNQSNIYYVGTVGYYNNISYNNDNGQFNISSTTATSYFTNEQQLEDAPAKLNFYIEYYNCYIVVEDKVQNQNNFTYGDFIQYVVTEQRTAITPKFLNSTQFNNIISSIKNNSFNRGYDGGYNDGYDEGYNTGVSQSNNYDAGFNDGYAQGIGDNIIPKNIIGWFRIVSRGVQSVLDIEILPYMKIGYIISIPIMFGLILFIIRLVRGD